MGWLTGWTCRRQITVRAVPGAGTDYQICLRIAENLTTEAAHLSLLGQSALFPTDKNDSGDIRFTTSDGQTLCPLWVERVTGTSPNRVATVWVKVPVSLETDQVLYCYFGNAGASNVSSGTDVFLVFDDFDGGSLDTNLWDAWGFGSANWSVSVSGGEAVVASNDSGTGASLQFKTGLTLPIRYGGAFRGVFNSSYGEFYASNIYSNPPSVSDFVRHGYVYSSRVSFYYTKRTGGTLYNYQKFSRSQPSVTTPFLVYYGVGKSLYYENGVQVNTITTQDRYTTETLFALLQSYNNAVIYADYLYLCKAVETDVAETFWCPSCIETSDVAPLQPQAFSVLGEISTLRNTHRADMGIFHGTGVITGSVSVQGTPARRRVLLLDRKTLRVLGIAWSDPVTGGYEFQGLNTARDYMVVCDDYTRSYNAAVADWVRPEEVS